jgi:hypothetical protein
LAVAKCPVVHRPLRASRQTDQLANLFIDCPGDPQLRNDKWVEFHGSFTHARDSRFSQSNSKPATIESENRILAVLPVELTMQSLVRKVLVDKARVVIPDFVLPSWRKSDQVTARENGTFIKANCEAAQDISWATPMQREEPV